MRQHESAQPEAEGVAAKGVWRVGDKGDGGGTVKTAVSWFDGWPLTSGYQPLQICSFCGLNYNLLNTFGA